ncbi:MAG: hypothetical protein AAFX87_10080 [Bacteroidota bacterium]
MKRLYRVVLLLGLFSCIGCDNDPDEEEMIEIKAATGVRAVDIANDAAASDMEVSFSKPNPRDNVSEFRMMVVKAATTFGLTQANAVSSDNYIMVERNGKSSQLRLDELQTDTDGDEIVEGTAYQVYVLSVAEPGVELDNTLSNPSSEVTLTRASAVRTLTSQISAGSGGMDVDSDGNIYMADFGANLNGGGNRVYQINPEGDVSIFATGLNGASGNDFDSDGNLFQSSITGGFISKITPTGQVSIFASDGIVGPVGVTVAGNGDMYVANCGNNTIQKVTKDGVSSTFSTGAIFNCPNGIDMDNSGNLYVANFSDGNVIKVTPNGVPSVFANIPGGNNGHLLFRGNELFVIARSAHRIYKVDMNSNVSLFAGTGNRGLSNGGLDQATFSLPNDLAFNPDGTKMYINDVATTTSAGNIISPVVIRVIEIVE